MTPHLNWQLDDDENWFAPIFLGYSLNIFYNGEDWYNAELFNKRGNEVGGICGGKTITETKNGCLNWLTKELSKVSI